jgi:hypothetical protein
MKNSTQIINDLREFFFAKDNLGERSCTAEYHYELKMLMAENRLRQAAELPPISQRHL